MRPENPLMRFLEDLSAFIYFVVAEVNMWQLEDSPPRWALFLHHVVYRVILQLQAWWQAFAFWMICGP